MANPLKVYRWTRPPRNHMDKVVAARSKTEARRLLGSEPIEITNEHTVMFRCRTFPGTVFKRVGLSGKWTRE